MFCTDVHANSVVVRTAEAFLPAIQRFSEKNHSNKHLGVHIILKLNGRLKKEFTKFFEEKIFRKYIHIVVLGDYSVFVAVTDERFIENIENDVWVNTSNHELHWKFEGLKIIDDVFFDGRKELYDFFMNKYHNNNLTYQDIDFFNSVTSVEFANVSFESCENGMKKVTHVEKAFSKLYFR